VSSPGAFEARKAITYKIDDAKEDVEQRVEALEKDVKEVKEKLDRICNHLTRNK